MEGEADAAAGRYGVAADAVAMAGPVEDQAAFEADPAAGGVGGEAQKVHFAPASVRLTRQISLSCCPVPHPSR